VKRLDTEEFAQLVRDSSEEGPINNAKDNDEVSCDNSYVIEEEEY